MSDDIFGLGLFRPVPQNWKCAKCSRTFDPLANARRDPRTAQDPRSIDFVCIPCYRELRPNGL